MSDITSNMRIDSIKLLQQRSMPWQVTLVDTGADSMTGGRLKSVTLYLKGEDTFLLTLLGALDLDTTRVQGLHEKPKDDDGMINTGFFMLLPPVIDLIDGERCI
jgi:glucose-1-phosphate cytidylyltransferase